MPGRVRVLAGKPQGQAVTFDPARPLAQLLGERHSLAPAQAWPAKLRLMSKTKGASGSAVKVCSTWR
ncbi:hypothetical protein D3C86_2205320 [compost metagenome]